MVTWGSNTVHSIAGNLSPAPIAFGAPNPAPATGFSFGSPSPSTSSGLGAPSPAPTTLFGSSSPAPSGSLFGSASPAPSTSLFGSSAPASSSGSLFGAPSPSGGLFGSSLAPSGSLFGSTSAPSGGLFGSTSAPTAGSLFGSPAPAPFGQSNPVQQQQIPAQAALKAHLDATARQEQARVQEALEKIHKAYTGTALALADKSSQFVSIVYNPMTPELRQMQLATGIGVDGMPRPMEPPKPPQVSTHDWEVAVVSNPDYASFMPIALVGAEALQARLTHQQEKSNLLSKQIKSLQSSQEFLRRRFEEVQTQLNQTSQRSEQQQRKLLAVMRRVELARCYNQPLQGDEVKAMERLRGIWADLDRLRSLAGTMHDQVKTQTAARPPTVCGMPEERRLMQVLKEHRSTLAAVTGTVQKDMLDLHLIQKRIKQVGRVHPAGPPRG